MRLIVTRPAVQAPDALRELHALGIDAVALPLIGIEPLAGEAAAGGGEDRRSPLGRCWATLAEQRLVMFVSANAVEHFFAAAPAGASWPAAVLAGSTGPGTSGALRRFGVPEACLVQPGADAPRLDSEALWEQLRGRPWRQADVLIVRGEGGGRDWFAKTLRSAGARVQIVEAYRRTVPQPGADEAALLAAAQAQPGAFAWHFSSSEAVRNLLHLAPSARWRASVAFATHPRIAEAARAAGFTDVRTPAPGAGALAAAWRAVQAG